MESPAYQKMGLELMDFIEDSDARNAYIFNHDRSFYFEALKRDDTDKSYLRELFELVDEEIDVEILKSGKKARLDSLLDGPPEATFYLISFSGDYLAVLVMKNDEIADKTMADFDVMVAEIESELKEILQTDTRQQPPTFAL